MARKGETLVVENIREYILSIEPSAHIYKVYGSGYSKKGEPDLLVCFRGRFVGLEVKDPKNKSYGATALQIQRIKEIRNSGGIAAVVTSPEDVEVLLYENQVIQASERRYKIPKEKENSSSTLRTRNRKNSNDDKKVRRPSGQGKSKKNTNSKSNSSSTQLEARVKNFLEE